MHIHKDLRDHKLSPQATPKAQSTPKKLEKDYASREPDCKHWEKRLFFKSPIFNKKITCYKKKQEKKEERICNGDKTVSPTSGAGKTGQPHVKQ